MTTTGQHQPSTRRKQQYRKGVTCSHCDYRGDMPWVRNESVCLCVWAGGYEEGTVKEWQFVASIDGSVMADTEKDAVAKVQRLLSSHGSVDIDLVWTEDDDDLEQTP